MRGKRVGGLAVAACLALPCAAEASKLSAEYEFSSRPDVHEAINFTYTAAPGERNDLRINETSLGVLLTTFSDSGALITEATPLVLGTSSVVALACVPALVLVTCTSPMDSTRTTALLGDGNDRARADGTTSALFDGGAGNDTTGGGSAAEYSIAGPGADAMLGGGGHDTVNYSGRTTPLTVTLDGVANDGAPGEGDNVGVDVEYIRVGSGGSTVIGSAIGQHIDGDVTPGAHHFVGGGGDDRLWGGYGNDVLEGGTGNDDISPSSGNDEVDAGPGNDTISLHRTTVADADHIACGDGEDTVHLSGGIDPQDIIDADCEVVT